MRTIRAQLEGVDAEPGRIAAADVARIIIGLERAIARAAYLARMAADLGIGDRNTSMTLSAESVGPDSDGPLRATIDAAVRERMQRISEQSPPLRDEAVVGVLFEADFEANTARVRLVDGGIANVTFSEDLADRIYEALRSRARFDGIVRYHPRTHQVTGIELRSVVRSTQPPLDVDSFWAGDTFSGLQETQRTRVWWTRKVSLFKA